MSLWGGGGQGGLQLNVQGPQFLAFYLILIPTHCTGWGGAWQGEEFNSSERTCRLHIIMLSGLIADTQTLHRFNCKSWISALRLWEWAQALQPALSSGGY